MKSVLMASPVAVAAGWVATYLFITILPLIILLLHPTPTGRSFWIELSVALGFIGLAMMALQFALTARINRIETSYGFDIVLQFHRYISLVAFALVLIHPIILFVNDPSTLQLLNFFQAPWRARAAVVSTLALILLVVTSVWRQKLKIPYEDWRIAHGVFAVLAVGLGLLHGLLVGNYLGLFWKAVVWTVMALAALWLLVYVRVIKPWFMIQKSYLVEDVVAERGDVWTLILRPRGHEGMPFEPGQFAWITLDISPFRMREHPFSLSSSAECPDRLEFSIKALGDFTNEIQNVKPGTKAFLDGPYGVFTTERYPDTSGFVFIAGGIGITPFMSMLRTMAQRNDDRPVTLIYSNKTWDGITFREELEELKDELNLTTIHVLREASDDWEGETGYVDKDLLERYVPKYRKSRQYFICAAPKMMDQVEAALHDLEVPITQVHMEHFNMV